MTEPRKKAYAEGSSMELLIDEGSTYSKDYWDLVFEQLGRRPMFKLGVALLALLYAVAIYAPLIANDRPYVLEAIDYKGYNSAARSLSAVAGGIGRLAGQTPEEYLEQRSNENAPATLEDALAVQQEAARTRFETIARYLPEESLGEVRELGGLIATTLEHSRAGDPQKAAEVAAEAKTLAKRLRKELKAADPEKADEGGMQLVPSKSYPLFESISHWEVFFMLGWAVLLLWPLWNPFINRVVLRGERAAIRRCRKLKVALVVGSGILGAVAWAVFVGGTSATFDVAPYKAGLTDGDIVATSPTIFAPIAVGYAETHTEENFRPPTWTRNSQLDEEGRFMYGLRRAKPDPVTGYLPPATPVVVRAGEAERNSPWRHIAGTDELGRDFFVRMIWGGRVSLSIGILSALVLTFLGVVIGSIAGYFGGWIDVAIMRVIEILQSIPAFFLILVTLAFTDPNVVPPIIAIVVVIALIRWTGTARLVRGEFLRLREQEFVIAARALGFSSRRTIFRHVLPNALGPVLVSATFSVAAGILTESAISFLGFGIQHPGASWGSLVNESKSPDHWWIQVFPGALIFITVTCYNLVGDAVRDALDPKMKV